MHQCVHTVTASYTLFTHVLTSIDTIEPLKECITLSWCVMFLTLLWRAHRFSVMATCVLRSMVLIKVITHVEMDIDEVQW